MANPYTNETGVFKNKLGFTDANQLKSIEYEVTSARAEDILTGEISLGVSGYGLERQAAIHKHLFQDVYEWAGKTRTVPSSKRADNGMVSRFAEPDAIAKDWQELEKKTSEFVAGRGLSFEHKRAALCDIFIAANRIHAFPEGNGRCLQVFMKELAREQGVDLDYTKVDSREWNLASAVSATHGYLFERVYLIPSPPNPEPIKKIFAEIVSPTREQDYTSSPSRSRD